MFASKRLRNYVAGLGTGSFRMILQVAVGLWLTPFILHYLDRQEFAIFTLSLEVLNWLTLLDVGITAGLRAQAARFNNHQEQDRTNRLASTAFYTQNIIVLVVLGIGFWLSLFFPHYFPIRAELQHEARIVMALCVLGVAVTVATQTFSALLVANQQMHVDNMIGVLLIVIRTVLIVVFLKLGFGLVSLAIAHVVARMTTAVLALFRVHRLLPGLRISFKLASWAEFRQMGSVGIWLSLAGLAGVAIDSLGNIVSAKVISMEAVTSLVLTSRLYELAGSFVWLLSETARPILGELLGQNKMDEGLIAYRYIFALSTGLATVAILAVWAGNACFISDWVGRGNYAGGRVDVAVAIATIIHLWVLPNNIVLAANLWVRRPCLVRVCEGAISLGLATWLGHRYGLFGVVGASVTAAFLTSFWLLPSFVSRMFDRSFWQFLVSDSARVFALVVCFIPIAFLARNIALDISGFPGAVAGACITSVAGGLLFWFVMLDKQLRARFGVRDIYEKICGNMRRVAARGSAA